MLKKKVRNIDDLFEHITNKKESTEATYKESPEKEELARYIVGIDPYDKGKESLVDRMKPYQTDYNFALARIQRELEMQKEMTKKAVGIPRNFLENEDDR